HGNRWDSSFRISITQVKQPDREHRDDHEPVIWSSAVRMLRALWGPLEVTISLRFTQIGDEMLRLRMRHRTRYSATSSTGTSTILPSAEYVDDEHDDSMRTPPASKYQIRLPESIISLFWNLDTCDSIQVIRSIRL